MTSMIYLFYLEIPFIGKSHSTVSCQWTKWQMIGVLRSWWNEKAVLVQSWQRFFTVAAGLSLHQCFYSYVPFHFLKHLPIWAGLRVCDKLPSHLSLVVFFLLSLSQLSVRKWPSPQNVLLFLLLFSFHKNLVPLLLQLHSVPLGHFPSYFGVCSHVLHLHWWVE